MVTLLFVDFSSHLIIFIGMQLQTKDSSELVRRLENSAHTVQYAAIKSLCNTHNMVELLGQADCCAVMYEPPKKVQIRPYIILI